MVTAMAERHRRIVLTAGFWVVEGLLACLAPHRAAAQPVYELAPAYQPPAHCKGSTLNGETMMRLIRKTIAHGDLTDVAFIEKTFHAQFSVVDKKGYDGEILPTYQTESVFGNPIHLEVFVNHTQYTSLENVVAQMTIGDRSFSDPSAVYIEDCLHIPQSAFSSYFGKDFLPAFANDGPPPTSAGESDGTPAKHNSKIYLGYESYALGSAVPVSVIDINQRR
jgi:hypothetical protein